MTGPAAPPPPGGAEIIRDLFGKAESETDLLLSRLQLNDIDNSVRLIKRFGRDLICIKNKEASWYVWSGKFWDAEHGGTAAEDRAHDTARLIRDEARAAELAGPKKDKDGEPIETPKEFVDRVKKIAAWSTASGQIGHINGMLRAAEKGLTRDRSSLDANEWLFNVENGTLELNPDGTVHLRPHSRKDLITRVAPVVYDPAAECPRFLEWLRFILPDPEDITCDADHFPVGEMRGMLQRFFGYCLTGSAALQVAPLFCGTGANGKSTLLNVIRGIFGPYAQTLPVETLLENDRKGGGDATPDIARLPGVRLALASEPEKKARLSTARLKQFTGGEPITARALYGGFFEFQPSFKVVLSFNDRPSVPAQDDGTWRRLLLVMFNQKIPREQRRDRYELDLLKEASGILNWLIEGYAAWRTGGMAVPAGVRAATDDYRNDNDPLGQFLVDCFVPEKDLTLGPRGESPFERAAQLYSAYEVWCEDAAADPVSKRVFGLRLRDKGYARGHSNGSVYENLQLTDEWRAKGSELLYRRQARAMGARGQPRGESVDDVATRVGANEPGGPKEER